MYHMHVDPIELRTHTTLLGDDVCFAAWWWLSMDAFYITSSLTWIRAWGFPSWIMQLCMCDYNPFEFGKNFVYQPFHSYHFHWLLKK